MKRRRLDEQNDPYDAEPVPALENYIDASIPEPMRTEVIRALSALHAECMRVQDPMLVAEFKNLADEVNVRYTNRPLPDVRSEHVRILDIIHHNIRDLLDREVYAVEQARENQQITLDINEMRRERNAAIRRARMNKGGKSRRGKGSAA